MRSPFRAVYLAARIGACSGALLVAGCGGGGPKSNAGASTRGPSSTALAGHPQVAVLHLSAGRSTARFTIVALPPAQFAWNARVTAPASADLHVSVLTWYGVKLDVLKSTRNGALCSVSHGRSNCVTSFPLLEAQRAGRWAVVASKRSTAPASVRVAITFSKP